MSAFVQKNLQMGTNVVGGNCGKLNICIHGKNFSRSERENSHKAPPSIERRFRDKKGKHKYRIMRQYTSDFSK
jgi:hypothetical protein